jgi:ABC-type transport system involved in multi-copper enzyme maturation permease subunit
MTPIHDQTYRRYQGPRQPPGRAWGVIASAGIRGMLGKRLFLALVVLAWLPFVVRSIQIYVVTMYPQARQVVPVDLAMFRNFVEFQGLFAFFVTVYVGAGLIANDRRANALQLYLSKPLLRSEYVGGKLLILLVFLLWATMLPALLLVAMQVILSGSLEFVRASPVVVPAVILASLVRVLVAAFTMLALSSLSKSARYVAVLYAGVIFFSEAMYGVLRLVTGSTRVAWVSVTGNLSVVTDAIFQQPPRYETPIVVSVIVLAGLIALSVSVLERRVRGVEVVA